MKTFMLPPSGRNWQLIYPISKMFTAAYQQKFETSIYLLISFHLGPNVKIFFFFLVIGGGEK
jgi:hypothetical protein